MRIGAGRWTCRLAGELQVGEARERAEHALAVVVPVQGGRLQRARRADAGSSQLREVAGQARRRGAEALDGDGGQVGRQRREGFEQVRDASATGMTRTKR